MRNVLVRCTPTGRTCTCEALRGPSCRIHFQVLDVLIARRAHSVVAQSLSSMPLHHFMHSILYS